MWQLFLSCDADRSLLSYDGDASLIRLGITSALPYDGDASLTSALPYDGDASLTCVGNPSALPYACDASLTSALPYDGDASLTCVGNPSALPYACDASLTADGDTSALPYDCDRCVLACDGDNSKEPLLVADGKLDVTWYIALCRVVGCVACKLEDLGSEVLDDGSELYWDNGTDGTAAAVEVVLDATGGELKAGFGREAGKLS